MSADTSAHPSSAFPPSRRGLSTIRVFPVVIAAVIVALAALSLSCTWQERMELGLAQGINQIRMDRGLSPLIRDPQLSAIARLRAQDMANYGYFAHTPPDGCAARCLMERAGLGPQWAGEVIAWSTAPADRSADMTVASWRNSPQHIAVITHGCFTRMGTGAALAADGRFYHVAVFEGRAPGC